MCKWKVLLIVAQMDTDAEVTPGVISVASVSCDVTVFCVLVPLSAEETQCLYEPPGGNLTSLSSQAAQ